MQRVALLRAPTRPPLRHFPDGGVRAAGHVTEDSIEEAPLASCEELWVLLGVVVQDSYVRRVQAIHLVGQEVRPSLVGVVGNHEAPWRYCVRGLLPVKVVAHDEFERLRCLTAGGRAHIEDRVVGLDSAEERGQHADDLLAGDQPRLVAGLEKLVERLEALVLLQEVPADVRQLEDELLRVVGLTGHLHLRRVELQNARVGLWALSTVLRHLVLIVLVQSTHKRRVGLDEFRVFQHLHEPLEADHTGVKPEGHRQVFGERAPKQRELIFAEDVLELLPVVCVKNLAPNLELLGCDSRGVQLLQALLSLETLTLFVWFLPSPINKLHGLFKLSFLVVSFLFH